MSTSESNRLRLDRALRVGRALKDDLLDRQPFATQVAKTLEAVTLDAGLVVSVEGSWGSGKSSVLAMVEELLQREPEATCPVVVRFNPWLIGDRDALLRQFLSSIAKEVKLTDHVKEGKRVGKELKTYARAFDLLKLIPGAEPWASIVQSVVKATGNAATAVFDHKTPDIEADKQRLEGALRKFPRRIVVLIDDIDRLFAVEAFEMVRIIKAVGDLPNIGYVLAWDEKYVSGALDKLGVPLASSYLDKVVQVRLRVPPLSLPQRIKLMNLGLERLDQEAHGSHFPREDERQAELFHSGLGELMEHPRDIVRLFDVLVSIEPGLRGEIQLSDILGLAALMTKSSKVYDLLHSQPQAFVGRRPGSQGSFKKAKEVVALHTGEREAAIAASASPAAVRDLVHWLFPDVASHDDAFTLGRVQFSEGHLAHPDRMLVALQLSARPNDVSLKNARDFILRPEWRDRIAALMDPQSCIEFVSAVAQLTESLDARPPGDVLSFATAMARLVEGPAFAARLRGRSSVFMGSPRGVAMRAIAAASRKLDAAATSELAESLISDGKALAVATTVASLSFFDTEREVPIKASRRHRKQLVAAWADNVERALDDKSFFERPDASWVLWEATRLVPERCSGLFEVIRREDQSLDMFAEQLFRLGFDSDKGQIYGLPDEVERVERYATLDVLKHHAQARVASGGLPAQVLAAWRSILEEKRLYGKDGSEADD